MKIKELEGRKIIRAWFDGKDPVIQLDCGTVLYLDEHDSFDKGIHVRPGLKLKEVQE